MFNVDMNDFDHFDYFLRKFKSIDVAVPVNTDIRNLINYEI